MSRLRQHRMVSSTCGPISCPYPSASPQLPPHGLKKLSVLVRRSIKPSTTIWTCPLHSASHARLHATIRSRLPSAVTSCSILTASWAWVSIKFWQKHHARLVMRCWRSFVNVMKHVPQKIGNALISCAHSSKSWALRYAIRRRGLNSFSEVPLGFGLGALLSLVMQCALYLHIGAGKALSQSERKFLS